MFGTDHHTAFDAWWEYARDNYVSWSPAGTAAAIDLYYDPVVDEHVLHGPVGLVVPGWYLAPQRRDVAEAAWRLGAMLTGALGDGPIAVPDPAFAMPLVQLGGEFADASTKGRIWAGVDEHLGPTWDRDAGEFTFGFGLGEEHPRGQWNARAMAGWVCTTGAWSDVFNRPNLAKFEQPTVVDVDFPRVAMSVARWDGTVLHLAASPQNASVRGARTTVRLTNLGDQVPSWALVRPDGEAVPIAADGEVELTVDNAPYRAHPAT